METLGETDEYLIIRFSYDNLEMQFILEFWKSFTEIRRKSGTFRRICYQEISFHLVSEI